jgi:hypothetical protein
VETWSFSGFHLKREELNEPSISYFMHPEIWNAPSSLIIHIGMQQTFGRGFRCGACVKLRLMGSCHGEATGHSEPGHDELVEVAGEHLVPPAKCSGDALYQQSVMVNVSQSALWS